MKFHKSLMSLVVLGAAHSAVGMDTPESLRDKMSKKAHYVVDHLHTITQQVKNDLNFFDASTTVIEKNIFETLPFTPESLQALKDAFKNARENKTVEKVVCDLMTQEKKKVVAKITAIEITNPEASEAADKVLQFIVKFKEKQENLAQ